MSFRAQVSIIESIATPGTWTKYDSKNLPPLLAQASLPALLLLEPADDRTDMIEATFQQGLFETGYTVCHILVVQAIGTGPAGRIPVLGDMIDYCDTYLAAARLLISQFTALPGGFPPTITVSRRIFSEGLTDYFAREFTWRLKELT